MRIFLHAACISQHGVLRCFPKSRAFACIHTFFCYQMLWALYTPISAADAGEVLHCKYILWLDDVERYSSIHSCTAQFYGNSVFMPVSMKSFTVSCQVQAGRQQGLLLKTDVPSLEVPFRLGVMLLTSL